jgi:ribonuclease HI
MKSEIIVFTDGSSRGNPGPGGWGTMVSFDNKVVELGGFEDETTNNRMEMSAAREALSYLHEYSSPSEPITIHTDSKYLIDGITKWVFGWSKNGWITTQKKEVENRDLWEALMLLVKGKKITWKHVDGHSGIPANERCDEIATAFADEKDIDLYNGPKGDYGVDLSITEAEEGAKKPSKKSSNAKAYSYLSLVGNVFKIHKTWTECEKEVQGKKGARFKKSFSASDEGDIKREWGIR